MNFDFSPEQKQLRDEARRFLSDRCPSERVREVLEGSEPFDLALWSGLAEMGFLGIAIPETHGGLGLGYLELCVVAEELGRVLAPVPFLSSSVLATEFLLAAGDDDQKTAWLSRLAAGEAIGTVALVERSGPRAPRAVNAVVSDGVLTGVKVPVPDGVVADFAIVSARAGPGDTGVVSLWLVDLNGPGVDRVAVQTIDPTCGHARVAFEGAPVRPLGRVEDGAAIVERVYDRAAVVTAFEQIGGADRALELARDYALDRMAFGRAIGSFQAIKHMLADMYVSATLARSNAYYGAWALSTAAPELPQAAATARISATQAFQHCARNGIQVHGGMGFTWEFDCHLYYRRANLLALTLGAMPQWEERLLDTLRAKIVA